MSDAYTPAITLPENTADEIEDLKARGLRLRKKGLTILGTAAAATAVAIGALLLYLNVQPISSFSTIDLPALDQAVATVSSNSASTPSLTGLADSPFTTPFENIRSLMTGTIPKLIAILGMVMGGIIAVARGSMVAAIPGVFMAVMFTFLPSILDQMVPQVGSAPSVQQADGNHLLRQLVDEKRYKELAGASGDLMPPVQATYLKAQIAYLTKDSDALKNELDVLAGSKPEKWSPDWERMNVLETEAYGSPRIQGTVQFVTGVQGSMQSRYRTFSVSAGVATFNFILGGCLFGFGMMLVRRARRLEDMLGIVLSDAKPVSDQNQKQHQKEAGSLALAYQEPSWTRSLQRTDADPVAYPSGPVLAGAAAGIIASSMLDDGQPPNSAPEGSPSTCSPANGPLAFSDANCIAGELS